MDELIARWQKLADQPKEEIAAQFNDEARSLFAEFLMNGLGGAGPQGIEWASAEEFAERVLDLRSNEKAWSRHLGDTLLRAQDLSDDGQVERAKQELISFRDTCPWILFADIAATQLENMGD
ncbi:hypothetical protein [Variovorax paradoxus]|uniref:hypothetical protein n=1 Tax=Variovorax paradoxus TaxID=34073 RepID=UPI001ABC7AD5